MDGGYSRKRVWCEGLFLPLIKVHKINIGAERSTHHARDTNLRASHPSPRPNPEISYNSPERTPELRTEHASHPVTTSHEKDNTVWHGCQHAAAVMRGGLRRRLNSPGVLGRVVWG